MYPEKETKPTQHFQEEFGHCLIVRLTFVTTQNKQRAGGEHSSFHLVSDPRSNDLTQYHGEIFLNARGQFSVVKQFDSGFHKVKQGHFALSLMAKTFIKHLPLLTSTFVGSCRNASYCTTYLPAGVKNIPVLFQGSIGHLKSAESFIERRLTTQISLIINVIEKIYKQSDISDNQIPCIH